MKKRWYSGTNQTSLENDLAKLDQNKAYFLRTGTNNGAGHWQTLFFDRSQQGWIRYSTQTNQHKITHEGLLTELGNNLLTPFAPWGERNGDYSFLLVDATG